MKPPALSPAPLALPPPLEPLYIYYFIDHEEGLTY